MSFFNDNSEQLLNRLEELTKQAKKQQVLQLLMKILKSHPADNYLPRLARFANRNHAYVLALRILHPLIQRDREKIQPASGEVFNVYATSLLWIGALEEAQACLRKVKDIAEAHLTEAFVYFAKWDYEKSLPVLKKYISSDKTTDYQKLVGQINLLAAYTSLGNVREARLVLEKLSPILESNSNFQILFGNMLELKSQIELRENKPKEALQSLAQSEIALAQQPGRYLLYVRKWKAIAQLTLNPSDTQAMKNLMTVNQEALKLRNWETRRDCDFHFARITKNTDFLNRVLLGTPYQGYHDRIEDIYGITVPQDKKLEYIPGVIAKDADTIGLNLEDLGAQNTFNKTSIRLLQLMTKDIYRPPRMGVVFSTLYPDEYFNPYSSPQRVRNSVFRFNEWAEENHIQFRIKIISGDFFLVGPKDLGITCVQRERLMQTWQVTLNYFKKKNTGRSFTSTQLAKILGMSQRNALHLIAKGLESGKLQKMGKGKNCRYLFFTGRRVLNKKAA